MLNTIRSNEKELKMNRAILKILLSDEEQLQVRMKAKWKDELNDFKIPPFILKQNAVQFPKLSEKQGKIFHSLC